MADWSPDWGGDFAGGTAGPPGQGNVQVYLNLFTAQYRNKPNLQAWARVVFGGLVDAMNVALTLPELFDIDVAVGDQLDKVGEWIGPTRNIAEPLQLQVFSFDTPGLGFDQAAWAQPYPPAGAAVVVLDDQHYRLLLKVAIIRNNWDGSREGAYAAWRALFGPEDFQILIQEPAPKRVPYLTFDDPLYGFDRSVWYVPGFAPTAANDMTILYALVGPPMDALTLALFTGGYLNLVPAGVHVDYATQSVQGVPMFAFDDNGKSPYLAGFDIGAWATITPGS